MCVFVHGASQGVYLPYIQCFWDRLQILCNPDQVTKDELMNDAIRACCDILMALGYVDEV